MANWIQELDDESWAIMPDNRILITQEALDSIADYTRSQPTAPSAGRVYKQNFPHHREDHWYIFIVEESKEHPGYQEHHPHEVEVITHG